VQLSDDARDDEELLARELGLLVRTAAEHLLRLRYGFLRLEKWVAFIGAGVSMA